MKYLQFVVYVLLFFGCHYSSNKTKTTPIDSLSILMENDSLDFSLLKQRASLYLDNSQLNLAKQDIDNAYAIFRNDVDLLLIRGIIYYQLNQTRTSKESWERCVEINPNNIECRTNLTELLCAVRDVNCKSMIDTLSLLNNGIVSTALIAYLKELKEYELAITLLNNLFLNSPNDKEILSLLSVIHSDTSSLNPHFNVDLAEQYFEKIIFLHPDYFQVYYNFGKHKQNLLQYNQALSYYRMALELDSVHRQTYYNMGFCNMQLKKYDKSISYFTQAINLDNSFLMAYHARAYVYELNNNIDKAKIDWKNCLMLNPSYIPALEGLNK